MLDVPRAGKDWIYCTLNNYGGNNGNFGLLPTILSAPAAAHKKVALQGLNNMVGVGLTLEGIHTNWVINEGLLEQGWRFTPQSEPSGNSGTADLTETVAADWTETAVAEPADDWYQAWVTAFAQRRYGSAEPALVQAWQILANRSEVSVYNGPRGAYFSSWGNTRSLVTRRPFWASGAGSEWASEYEEGTSAGFQGTAPRYSPHQLNRALQLLLSAVDHTPALKKSRALAVDCVDLAATVMANEFIILKQQLDTAAAGVAPNATAIAAVAEKMVANIIATDELLGSNENYLLGTWVADARQLGRTDAEKRLLEFNARNQVTLWGPAMMVKGKHGQTVPGPQDYAGKTWQGLFSTFYLPRQQLLFGMLEDAARAASNNSAIDFDVLGENFTTASLIFEGGWGIASNTSGFLSSAVGDTFALAKELLAKHGSTVQGGVWCAVIEAGQTSYNTDKLGATTHWQLRSYMENVSCPFPCLTMPWNQGYIRALDCD